MNPEADTSGAPSLRPFATVLVANRGEIAVRIIRTLRTMGIRAVAVYSEADRAAPHVEQADAAFLLGPPPALESYLRVDRILEAAQAAGAEAIHPGFGFLAENAEFARAVHDAGMVFIGPSPEAIEHMGDKLNSRRLAQTHGIPVIPAVEDPGNTAQFLHAVRRIGFPVLIKAAAGGGGKGMRVVARGEDFERALEMSRRESFKAFGSDRVFVEKYLVEPRHIEFQILADRWGRILHLNERECSIQRRHQKIIEESPSPLLDAPTRAKMGADAVRLAQAVNYTNAGTVEFMVDQQGDYFFLEMNTRLQVEHPVTEMTLGLDLVYWQVRIAEGHPLAIAPGNLTPRGHAMEARIYAEDPENNFLPAAGRIAFLREPSGPGIRNDCGVRSGLEVTSHYDPMISKLVTWGETRERSLSRMQQALRDYCILGLKTNREYLLDILNLPAFAEGRLHTGFLTEHLPEWHPRRTRWREALLAAAACPSRKDMRASPGAPAMADYNPWRGVGAWGR